jgi:Protein of unknown function (DUF3300)
VGHVTGLIAHWKVKRFVVFAVVFCSGIMAQKSVAQSPAPAAQAAPVDTSPATLDYLLAPIALYPDPLLMQVLAASVSEQEVLDGGNWLLQNKSLEGSRLDGAAKNAGFGAAMSALFHFPDVVDLMCTQLDWTRQLGAAFNADQAGVLASVQRLRTQAMQYGSLKTTAQQKVVTEQENGKQVIIIQPANPQVIYVPQYNPQVVYVSSGPTTSAVVISFGLGVAVGAMFSSNYYYYPRWGYGGVYYRGGPWYPVHYHYRPVYGPAFRPAYGYRPPANYPPRAVHYNTSYYNSFRPGGAGGTYRPPVNGGYNRPATLPANNARPANAGYNRPSTLPANGGNYNRPSNGAVTSPTTRPAVTPDRGYAKPATRPATQQQRPATQQQGPAAQQRPAAPAFSGGSSERSTQAASQRGAASVGARRSN